MQRLNPPNSPQGGGIPPADVFSHCVSSIKVMLPLS